VIVLRTVTGTPRVIAANSRGKPAGLCFVWAFASLLAAACAAPPEEGSSAEASAPTVTSERSPVDATAPVAKTENTSTEVARKSPPPPRKLPLLKELIGKSEAQVAMLFGKPSFVRNDEPARLFQYRSKKCALDIFLYRQGEGYFVSYTEIRGARSIVIAEPDCVNAVLNARTSGGNFR
jgi:hypothetical protein